MVTDGITQCDEGSVVGRMATKTHQIHSFAAIAFDDFVIFFHGWLHFRFDVSGTQFLNPFAVNTTLFVVTEFVGTGLVVSGLRFWGCWGLKGLRRGNGRREST